MVLRDVPTDPSVLGVSPNRLDPFELAYGFVLGEHGDIFDLSRCHDRSIGRIAMIPCEFQISQPNGFIHGNNMDEARAFESVGKIRGGDAEIEFALLDLDPNFPDGNRGEICGSFVEFGTEFCGTLGKLCRIESPPDDGVSIENNHD